MIGEYMFYQLESDQCVTRCYVSAYGRWFDVANDDLEVSLVGSSVEIRVKRGVATCVSLMGPGDVVEFEYA